MAKTISKIIGIIMALISMSLELFGKINFEQFVHSMLLSIFLLIWLD